MSLGLLVFLMRLVDWTEAVKTLHTVSSVPLVMAPLLSWGRLYFASWRMRIVLADNHVMWSHRQAYAGYLLGSFYSTFLPGVIGGDVVRIGRCTLQTHCRLGTAAVSVFLERICGVLALLGIFFCMYLFHPSAGAFMFGHEGRSALIPVAAIGMSALLVFLAGRRLWPTIILRRFGRGTRWSSSLYSIMHPLETLKTKTLGKMLILSLFFQLTDIVVVSVLARALGLQIPLSVFLAILPLVYVATLLPLSLGGLGVREGTLVFLLGRYGIAASDAVMLAFLVYLNSVFVGSAGGIMQVVETFWVNATRPEAASDRFAAGHKSETQLGTDS